MLKYDLQINNDLQYMSLRNSTTPKHALIFGFIRTNLMFFKSTSVWMVMSRWHLYVIEVRHHNSAPRGEIKQTAFICWSSFCQLWLHNNWGTVWCILCACWSFQGCRHSVGQCSHWTLLAFAFMYTWTTTKKSHLNKASLWSVASQREGFIPSSSVRFACSPCVFVGSLWVLQKRILYTVALRWSADSSRRTPTVRSLTAWLQHDPQPSARVCHLRPEYHLMVQRGLWQTL